MRKTFIAAFACLALAGCNFSGAYGKLETAVVNTNNVLARLANNQIPVACSIIGTAEGYFHALETNISPDKIAIERKAEASVAAICDNPPTNLVEVGQAFTKLVNLWFTIQNATKTS